MRIRVFSHRLRSGFRRNVVGSLESMTGAMVGRCMPVNTGDSYLGGLLFSLAGWNIERRLL